MLYAHKGTWIMPTLVKGYNNCYFNEIADCYLRKAFMAPASVEKAEINLCGLGVHELYVNGVLADERWYAPGLYQYDYRVGTTVYDVKHLIRPGEENVIMVHLGNGFYNCRNEWKYTVNFSSWRAAPRMVCDCFINDDLAVISGPDWKIHPSPVIYDCHHAGEDYDARLELPPEAFCGGYDDSDWKNATRALSPGGIVEIDTDEPCRVIERIPGKLISDEPLCKLFNFGKNFSGVAEVKMRGKSGSKITFRYGEMLDENGKLTTDNVSQMVKRFDTDTYTCKGEGVEVWHPHFVWHGFQYIEAVFEDADTEILDITGLFISSDIKSRGSFECSDPTLNQLQQMTLTSYRSNFMSLPTDCPTREKFGWTGDAENAMETGWFNFYCRNGLRRLMDLVMDIQRPDGNFTTHGPTTLWGFEQTCPSFSVYMYDFCRYCWELDGDDEPIKQYYDKLKLGAMFFEAFTRDDRLCHLGYGDWCHPIHHPMKRDTTAEESISLYIIMRDMAFMAEHLNKADDAAYFADLAEQIRQAVRKTYYNADTALYEDGFWAVMAMALCCGIVEESEKAAVAANLVKSVREANHQVWAGTLGSRFTPRALAENGYVEDAFKMITQKEYPGWGNIVAQGGTSLWEFWNGQTSRNHIMFGDISAWMYRYLGGIAPAAPGWKAISFKPNFIPQVDWVNTRYESAAGEVKVEWKRSGSKVECSLSAAANVSVKPDWNGAKVLSESARSENDRCQYVWTLEL